ncbi:methyl-accepting chemotaxis protein [Sporolactobacillus shoreicorticis]|uniref:Methyl-accepting chemotaxis protein n=1 Tax=Sporolactobacillus shoreicorticis TaxID=1923877 RepID=A0ABW5S7E9_9BACL|nr:methyl-accepting chemotaxis protein [Sporolactobacillus shoreicorticis]MCO7125755.1 methyl-accepting chemotaxis protein [Sporolactobacillus shoreicorticis]
MKNIFKRNKPSWSRLQLTISMKFSIGLWIVLILMLSSAAMSAVLLYQTMQRAEDAQRAGERAAQITEIGSLFRAKDARVVDYVLNPGDAAVKLYSQDQMKLTRAEKKLEPYMNTNEQKKWFSQIMSADARTFNLFQSEFVPAVLMNDKQKTAQVHEEQNKIQNQIINNVSKLRESVLTEEKIAMENIRKQVIGSMVFLVASVLLTIVLSSAVTLWISKQTKASFTRVIASTNKIASGDLRVGDGQEQSVHNKDELGLIAESIEKMKHNLLDMIQMIRAAALNTKNSGRTLITSTKSVSDESREMAEATNEISAGLENQATNTSNIAQFTEEFMNKLDQEVGTLSIVLNKALNASHLTEEGTKLIDQSQKNMKQIESSVLKARDEMGNFKVRLKDLNHLIEMIEHIAGQTNLLALNATIESARAGEYGKGFTVIAESIRKLSIQTTESAKDMANKLRGIHNGSEAVEQALVISGEQVRSGVKQIKSTGDALISIHSEAQNIGDSMDRLTERLHEVNQIGYQMKESIDAVAAVSQESSARVANVNQSMNRIEKTMRAVASESKILAETSDHFDQLMKRFKV